LNAIYDPSNGVIVAIARRYKGTALVELYAFPKTVQKKSKKLYSFRGRLSGIAAEMRGSFEKSVRCTLFQD
jgi:hypothetical protein